MHCNHGSTAVMAQSVDRPIAERANRLKFFAILGLQRFGGISSRPGAIPRPLVALTLVRGSRRREMRSQRQGSMHCFGSGSRMATPVLRARVPTRSATPWRGTRVESRRSN